MKKTVLAAALALGTSLVGGVAGAQNMMPFGSEEDAAYAALIWEAMGAANLVGDHMIRTLPYDGVDPHGKMLETFYTTATIGEHTGNLIIKRNFGPEGVDADTVLADPDKHLGAITVMYQREDGYDTDNQNWFWVKFLPDGTLDKNPKGMMLAGMVAKGADVGCIACHSSQDDYIFTTDAITPVMMMQ